MLVAVTGATGFVGRYVVERLLRRDHAVRVLARHEGRAGWMRDRGVEVVQGDLDTPGALAGLMRDAGAVIHLVGIIEELGRQSFQRVHVEGTRHVVTAAREAGVPRLVHMSALGARHDPAATAYHRSKAEAEDIVAGCGIPAAIMRPSLIAAGDNAVLTMLLRMLRFAPAVPVIGDGSYRLQPLAAEDLAEAFAVAVERPHITGRFDLAGPDQLPYREMIAILEDALGIRRRRITVPVAAARAGAWIGTLVPMVSPITPAQLTMLLEGNVTGRNAITETFGVTPRPFRDVAREICAPYRTGAAAS
jgi:uncharacterized protein YbjT (DUF2867 family)